MRRELDNLTKIAQQIIYQMQRQQENETHEREMMALRLENQLLKFERRLPQQKERDEE